MMQLHSRFVEQMKLAERRQWKSRSRAARSTLENLSIVPDDVTSNVSSSKNTAAPTPSAAAGRQVVPKLEVTKTDGSVGAPEGGVAGTSGGSDPNTAAASPRSPRTGANTPKRPSTPRGGPSASGRQEIFSQLPRFVRVSVLLPSAHALGDQPASYLGRDATCRIFGKFRRRRVEAFETALAVFYDELDTVRERRRTLEAVAMLSGNPVVLDCDLPVYPSVNMELTAEEEEEFLQKGREALAAVAYCMFRRAPDTVLAAHH